MKIKVLTIALLFATGIWAQNPAPTTPADQKAKPAAFCCKDKKSCCKEGSKSCRDGAGCSAKMAKGEKTKSCCGGKMCNRHKGEKS